MKIGTFNYFLFFLKIGAIKFFRDENIVGPHYEMRYETPMRYSRLWDERERDTPERDEIPIRYPWVWKIVPYYDVC